MPDLIAQGPEPTDRWRGNVETGVRFSIGRQAGPWSTVWDKLISRQHVEVVYRDGRLYVESLPSASNPVYFQGKSEKKFELRPGEHFVIGQTTFTLVDPNVRNQADLPGPSDQRTFVTDELHRRPFREPDKRISALSRLPDIFYRSASEQELFQRVVNLLLTGIDRATAAAVVAVDVKPAETTEGDAPVSVLHWDRHLLSTADFRPSHRLIRQAMAGHQSVAYVWNRDSHGTQHDFTLSDQTEWAICTPIVSEACPGWALYVAGSFNKEFGVGPRADPELLQDDVKYTEIMAATLGGLWQSRQYAARQASLSHFFSPIVLDALSAGDPGQVLAPRQANISTLFCDLRGFTSESERLAHDLFALLQRVSEALGVMTREILQQGGVIGDFHGDAAMGFWGWPIAQPDAAIRAGLTALRIRAHFEEVGCRPEGRRIPSSSRFRVGIGIATGLAVAGKIGTSDQVKVTAFGPVVNLASRLETMTRQLPAAILMDEPTAIAIQSALSHESCRVRRLARVRPLGLSTPLDVFELLPSIAECPDISDKGLRQYESSLAAFEVGDWKQAVKLLSEIPKADAAGQFLLDFMRNHNAIPPSNWDGAIHFTAK